MSRDPNEYHLVTFDPGAAGTGWAHFIIDARGFARPEYKILQYIRSWECGELTGPENTQIEAASRLIWRAKFGDMPYNTTTDVVASALSRADIVAEDFELTQMIGGRNLLSPVRINAKLDWECHRWGITLQYQRRTMRTRVNQHRLKTWGFDSPYRRDGEWRTAGKGKDAFSAMQHALVWLKLVKHRADQVPWKISDGSSDNAYWDCSCEDGELCDLIHPMR